MESTHTEKITHNLSDEYFQSLTEEERIRQMKEWTQYYNIGGTKTLEEFRDALFKERRNNTEEIWNLKEISYCVSFMKLIQNQHLIHLKKRPRILMVSLTLCLTAQSKSMPRDMD